MTGLLSRLESTPAILGSWAGSWSVLGLTAARADEIGAYVSLAAEILFLVLNLAGCVGLAMRGWSWFRSRRRRRGRG